MKKKSFEDRPKEEGFNLLNKIFRNKSKGTIYKLDWIISNSTESSKSDSKNINIIYAKK